MSQVATLNWLFVNYQFYIIALAVMINIWLVIVLLKAIDRWRVSRKSYQELLDDYHRWDRIVMEWRYPDGRPVEWGDRGKINEKYRESWRRVRNHPDHPKEEE